MSFDLELLAVAAAERDSEWRSRGLAARLDRSGQVAKQSAWVTLEGPNRGGQLCVWDSGEAELDVIVDGRVTLRHYEFSHEVGLRGALDDLEGILSGDLVGLPGAVQYAMLAEDSRLGRFAREHFTDFAAVLRQLERLDADLDLGSGAERVEAAVLWLGRGDPGGIGRALDLARRDSRDVLVATDLADDDWAQRLDERLGPA